MADVKCISAGTVLFLSVDNIRCLPSGAPLLSPHMFLVNIHLVLHTKCREVNLDLLPALCSRAQKYYTFVYKYTVMYIWNTLSYFSFWDCILRGQKKMKTTLKVLSRVFSGLSVIQLNLFPCVRRRLRCVCNLSGWIRRGGQAASFTLFARYVSHFMSFIEVTGKKKPKLAITQTFLSCFVVFSLPLQVRGPVAHTEQEDVPCL